MALSFNINILAGYIVITRPKNRVSDRQEKHASAQKSFYVQGIFSYIDERDTSSPDYCKYKHMLLKTELHLLNFASCTVC